MQTVTEWEKEHNAEYPYWASIWHYDAYGEAWEPQMWRDVKNFYENERKEDGETGYLPWQFYFEPMVLLPTDTHPKWGEGVPLKRLTTAST